MSPNVNIFFQLSCDAHVKFNRPCWCWVQWIHQYVWGNEWHYWTTGCVHEGLMRLLLSHWFPSENVNVFIIHSAKVYPCDVKLRRRPFIVWDALQDLLVCYQSWHIEQGKPTCHSWKKKKVELSVNLQPRCGILESGYISLVDYHHLNGNKGIDGNFCRFVSREFCSSPVSKFCLP